MSIIKNMKKVVLPDIRSLQVRSNTLHDIQHMLSNNMQGLWEHSKGIIGGKGDNYFQWAESKPSKAGFDFKHRLDFWAIKSGSYEPVAFLDTQGKLVFPWFIHENTVYCTYLEDSTQVQYPLTRIMPVFPNALRAMLTKECAPGAAVKFWGMYRIVQEYVNKLDDRHRTKWLKGNPTTSFDEGWHIEPTPNESEAIDELNSNDPLFTPEFIEQLPTTKKEESTMSKASQVKTGMIETNKDALKAVAYLNAGRASNKLIKESLRPMLNMMFKPTFMQKIGMKLFKMENPVDVALKSTMSDLFCAQLAQAIVELKGVENEHVREVTKSGITYAGLKVSELVPFEQAMDDVVAKLEQGAEGIVSKISKK